MDEAAFRDLCLQLAQSGDASRAKDVALRGLAAFPRSAVLHTYLGSANVFGAAAARLAGVPLLVTTRRDTGYGDGRLMRRGLMLSNRVAGRVVAVSRDVARIVVRPEAASVTLIASTRPRSSAASARSRSPRADKGGTISAVNTNSPAAILFCNALVIGSLPGRIGSPRVPQGPSIRPPGDAVAHRPPHPEIAPVYSESNVIPTVSCTGR